MIPDEFIITNRDGDCITRPTDPQLPSQSTFATVLSGDVKQARRHAWVNFDE
jgi:hypothetical protein